MFDRSNAVARYRTALLEANRRRRESDRIATDMAMDAEQAYRERDSASEAVERVQRLEEALKRTQAFSKNAQDDAHSLFCENGVLLERAERLEDALRGMRCPSCTGTGTMTGTCLDPHCGESYWDHECGHDINVTCTKCNGTGLHPSARAALEEK